MRLNQMLAAVALAGALALPTVHAEETPGPELFGFNQKVSYLGVNVQEIDAERAKALKLKEEAGVEVTRVEPGSPAERAGLKAGDAITEYNGQRVEGIEMFSRLVRETPAGRSAKLGVIRNGNRQTITAQIGSHSANPFADLRMPSPSARPMVKIPDVPRTRMTWRSSTLGIEAESLEGQLSDYFGVKQGVLVRSVSSGSAAEKAGMKAGDVIIKVDNSPVSTPSEVSSHLRSLKVTSVPVVVIREHKEMTLTVMLDDRAANRREDREQF